VRHVMGLEGGKRRIAALVVIVCFFCVACGGAEAAQLKSETRAAFARYVQLTNERNTDELKPGQAFLWIDTFPDAERKQAYELLASGKVEIAPLETLDAGKKIPCPDGMIHHWIATILIPGATLDDVLRILQDYDHHAEYYRPDVQRSEIEERDGNHFRVFLRFRRKKIISVVLDTLHDVQYFRDGPDRAHSRSSATRIAQVENAGQSDEREKPPGEDDGFLWGMETWWRMEKKNGGVYVQSEVVSLTRDIPTGLGWLIGPFVSSIPRESLTFTMEATRRAALAQKAFAENRATN
jgi:hypothetical protein